jgi:hypothetical protein
MAYGELEILADVQVERHHVYILYSLTLCSLIMKRWLTAFKLPVLRIEF